VTSTRAGALTGSPLLDPPTYRLIGGRHVAVADHVDPFGQPHRKGTVEGLMLRTAAAIVSRPGHTS
jgi:hypothetical protein